VALAVGWPDSLSYWEEAKDVYETLLAEKPEAPDRQRNVALVCKYLGAYFNRSKDSTRALGHLERALALDEARLSHRPEDRQARFDVANSISSVAYEYWQQGELQRAVELYERSLVFRQDLAEADPEDVLARNRLGYTHQQLGGLLEELGELSRALRHARASAALFGSLTTNSARFYAARGQWLLSRLEERQGRRAESCRASIEAFTIMSDVSREWVPREIGEHEDLAPRVASHAAECGDGAARDWLNQEPTAPSPEAR
jgi:tetratricopeptide (TPR) repeat protein